MACHVPGHNILKGFPLPNLGHLEHQTKDNDMLQITGNRNPRICANNRCTSVERKGSLTVRMLRANWSPGGALEMGLIILQPPE